MASSNEFIGRVLGGRYILRALVGTGASAQVFLADDTTLRRQVAVKVLHASLASDETFLRRFRREAESAAAMQNKYVLTIFDWGEQDGVPYIVTEYLGGGSLRDMLDTGYRLSVSQTLLVGLDAARGLEYAHKRGLVHRDIKPANLMFDEGQSLRIADFGLARALAEAGITEPAGSMVGTVRYASPEQAKSEALSAGTDIYSLALVLIECVTGDVPFAGETPLAALLARAEGPLRVPAALGPLRPALERAGAPNPEDRPDAEEFAIALMAAAEGLPRPAVLPIAGPRISVDDATSRDLTVVSPVPIGDIGAASPLDATTSMTTLAGSFPASDGETDVAAAVGGSRALKSRAAAQAAAVPVTVEDDKSRRRWPWVLLGLLLVAGAATGGVFAYLNNRTITHVMPDLRDRPAQELIDLAAENDWVLGKPIEQRDSEITEPGHIISVDPASGTKVAEGDTVTYSISLGPPPVPIPALVGKTVDEARSELESGDLVLGETIPEFNEEVESGRIISVETVGAEAAPGSPIDVKVSSGPEQRIIPADLVNVEEAATTQRFAEMDLGIERAEEFNADLAAGLVIRFEPEVGTPVDRDSVVKVFVSKGPEPRPVPNVFGLTSIAAAEKIRASGFEVGTTTGPVDRSVIATDPPAGEARLPGTVVNIFTRST